MKSCPKHGWIDTGASTDATCPVCRVFGVGSPMQVEEANRRYFNPGLWEKAQLVQIIGRYREACVKLLGQRYRDGECDACALSLFANEVQEIDDAMMKLREGL